MDFEGRRNPWEAEAIANAGKPFICEKPASDNLAGAGVVAAMGFGRRLDADIRAFQVFGAAPIGIPNNVC